MTWEEMLEQFPCEYSLVEVNPNCRTVQFLEDFEYYETGFLYFCIDCKDYVCVASNRTPEQILQIARALQ